MHCVNHQDVPGIGVCVECRKVVCESCTTRLQGRNFCRECLSDRGDEGASAGTGGWVSRSLVVLCAVASGALLWGMATSFGFIVYLVG